jgi:DNA-binding transcriptional MerR regulator
VSKGPDAFRTISEVAGELSLPQHVLRFWETRFTHIKPLKRGGGRRYYRPDDVELLRGIRHLLYGEGYTIRGVQRILKERGARFVIAAGHGEATARLPRRGRDADEAESTVDAAALNGVEDDLPAFVREPGGGVPPRLNSNGSGAAARGQPVRPIRRLSEDEKERLETTLGELLELKRLLDQSR